MELGWCRGSSLGLCLLLPPLPCGVLQQRWDSRCLKLLLARETHVADEAFHVVFPRLCQGEGWGWREEGFSSPGSWFSLGGVA